MTVEIQQGDIELFQTDDDGDILIEDGLVRMGGGIPTAAYLSLFGGNQDDDGRDDNPQNWWANLSEVDSARHYRSETQNLLRTIPITTGSLRRVEAAAQRDLAWFITEGVATSVDVVATIPALNTIALDVRIVADGLESSFEFIENWKADIVTQTPIPDEGLASTDIQYFLLEDGGSLLLEDGSKLELERR